MTGIATTGRNTGQDGTTPAYLYAPVFTATVANNTYASATSSAVVL